MDLFRPNYFRCLNALKKIKKFQDLVRHLHRWAYDIKLAKPLEDLLPKDYQKGERHEILKREINKLVPLVSDALYYAKVNTGIESTQEQEDDRKEYDLIHDIFDLPRGPSARTHELLMRSLERGIGVYEDRKRDALLEIFNPMFWIVWIIRLPIQILHLAGIKDSQNIFGKIYELLIKCIMAVLLALLCAKLGISIPWSNLF